MAGWAASRGKSFRLGAAGGLFVLGLALSAFRAENAPGTSGAGPAAPSSVPDGATAEAGIRALIGKDLYPGEKIERLTVVPEPEQSRIVARWEAHLVDDGRHFHPLFHPPTIILYQLLPGEAHFPALGTALSPKADSAPEFETWRKKLALTRSLMRQVVVLRCMLYCRHQMDALDRDTLQAAEEELSTLSAKPTRH
ncbi:MAG: hypothetical protein AB7T14_04730 [Candidatus Methylacidiphilaceae bacterium]